MNCGYLLINKILQSKAETGEIPFSYLMSADVA